MKQKLVILTFILSVLLPLPHVRAGTVLDTNKHAWSDEVGYINFEQVVVEDNSLSGHAWSTNSGWIHFNPAQGGVLNDGSGNLSGSAWGEQLGWIDFDNVSINAAGVFSGMAEGVLVGTITFDCPNYCDVETDWRPASMSGPPAPPSGGGGGGGGSGGTRSSFIPGLPETGSTASTSVGMGENSTLIQTIVHAIPRFMDLRMQPVLALGAVSENIRTLQVFLNVLGFTLAEVGPGSPGRETNIFGPLTKAALARFQAQNGIIPATGYFGPKTRAFIAALSLDPSVPVQTGQVSASAVAISPAFTRDLERGMSGPDVIALQQLLILKDTGPASRALTRSGTSTHFGPLTKAAVIEYQKAYGITPAVGYFGPITRGYIVAH